MHKPSAFSDSAPSVPADPSLRIVDLSLEDVGPMLGLFSDAIARNQLERSIYLSPGGGRYLAFLMLHPRFQWHEQLWGIKDEADHLLAAAHTRSNPGVSHLNNYAVAPQLQGKGLGSWMMKHWEGMAQAQGSRRQTLDVAEDNVRARKLYARHGFIDVSVTHEYRLLELPPPDADARMRLVDWPQAMACYESFGFGQFQVELDGQYHPVDLVSGRFRSSISDERLLAALRWMDPEREILLRSPGPAQPTAWQHTGAIIRMQKELA